MVFVSETDTLLSALPHHDFKRIGKFRFGHIQPLVRHAMVLDDEFVPDRPALIFDGLLFFQRVADGINQPLTRGQSRRVAVRDPPFVDAQKEATERRECRTPDTSNVTDDCA